MRVLMIEDDGATAQAMELMLKSEGMSVYTTNLGEEGIDLAKVYDYDIILLDLNLPDISGMDVLRTLRVGKIATPIMIVSGCSDIDTKVRTFGGGADDYMTKPFHKDELVARIHAVVRRSKGHCESVITTGNIRVNLDSKIVEVDGIRLHLTGKEYQMLELLSLRKGMTLTKEMFMNHLYGGMDEPELKIIDVFICKLRRKLTGGGNGLGTGGSLVETVWGRGYVLRDPARVAPSGEAAKVPDVETELREDERVDETSGEGTVVQLHGQQPTVDSTSEQAYVAGKTVTRVLAALLDGPKTSAQVAEELAMERTYARSLISKLRDSGDVQPADQKKKGGIYELTPTGRVHLSERAQAQAQSAA